MTTATNNELQDLKYEIRETKKRIEEMNKRVYEIEKNIELQDVGIKNNLDMIIGNTKDIDNIKDKPNQRESQIIALIITGIVTSVITYITSRL